LSTVRAKHEVLTGLYITIFTWCSRVSHGAIKNLDYKVTIISSIGETIRRYTKKKDPYKKCKGLEEGGDILSHQWQYHLR